MKPRYETHHFLTHHTSSKAQIDLGCSSKARSQAQLLFQGIYCARRESKARMPNAIAAFLTTICTSILVFNFSLQFRSDSVLRSLIFFPVVQTSNWSDAKYLLGYWKGSLAVWIMPLLDFVGATQRSNTHPSRNFVRGWHPSTEISIGTVTTVTTVTPVTTVTLTTVTTVTTVNTVTTVCCEKW
jgi:hypothetical protein